MIFSLIIGWLKIDPILAPQSQFSLAERLNPGEGERGCDVRVTLSYNCEDEIIEKTSDSIAGSFARRRGGNRAAGTGGVHIFAGESECNAG